MRRTELPPSLQRLITESPYVSLGTTCPGGTPWVTPVVAFWDEQLRLYWASWPHNQHSRNIACDDQISAVVFDSHAPLGEGEGLYVLLRATMLTDSRDIAMARGIYLDRYGETACLSPFANDCPRRIYRGQPYKIWTNIAAATNGHFVDDRQLLL